jgi:hypothetical protein
LINVCLKSQYLPTVIKAFFLMKFFVFCWLASSYE